MISDAKNTNVYIYIDLTLDKRIPFYIGKGNISRVKDLERNYKHDNIMNKHGIIRMIIKCENNKDAIEKEIFLIEQLKTFAYRKDLTEQEWHYACNFTLGGDGSEGYKHTQKALQKIKEKAISRIRKPHTQEWCQNISKANKGQKHSQYQDELRWKGVYKLDVLTNEILEQFSSIKEAALSTNTQGNSIAKCCKGFYKTANGYIWRYINDLEEEKRLNYRQQYEEELHKKKKNEVKHRSIERSSLKDGSIVIFENIQEASKISNVPKTPIYDCCRGKLLNAHSYIWKYVID